MKTDDIFKDKLENITEENLPILELDLARNILKDTPLKNLPENELIDVLRAVRQFCIISYQQHNKCD
jgi:hypothetical protein